MAVKIHDDHFSTHRFYDTRFKVESVKVLPGEYYASGDDEMITTLLGSCVAVCLYDADARVGGMNHFLLPDSDRSDDLLFSSAGRYGVYSMELLINHLIKIGGRRNHLAAKIFGGANVLGGNIANVGATNVDFTVDYLHQEGIAITGQDVGETCPRRVNFFPASGRVLMKRLQPTKNSELVSEELGYKKSITNAPDLAGDVDLF